MKKAGLNLRRNAILELISKQAVSDQAELVDLLNLKYDIQTNQAAVSRDLRSLGVLKRLRGLKTSYELPGVDVEAEILARIVKSIERNEQLIVINTLSATAAFLGDYLDAQVDLEILGTIAGENVVVVLPRKISQISELMVQLRERIRFKEGS